MELDHVFIMCAVQAPEAEALVGLGLTEGSANRHPGQGTACRRFFFENAYLELLWVDDETAATHPGVRRLELWERWVRRRAGACPFGIAVRPARNEAPRSPFPTWSYRPTYFPPGLSIDVAADTTLDEPAIFYMAFQRERARQGEEPDSHSMPGRHVTGVRFAMPQPDSRSPACRALEAAGLIQIEPANEHLVTLAFDHHSSGASADLRPVLPLVLRW